MGGRDHGRDSTHPDCFLSLMKGKLVLNEVTVTMLQDQVLSVDVSVTLRHAEVWCERGEIFEWQRSTGRGRATERARKFENNFGVVFHNLYSVHFILLVHVQFVNTKCKVLRASRGNEGMIW